MRVFFAHSAPSKRGEKMNVPAHRLLLGAILALSAFSNLSWLTREHANVYYAHLKALADIHEKKQVRWITDNCEQVPEGLWQSSTSTSSTSTVLLYDCGTRSR
jgi:hypothetical protein